MDLDLDELPIPDRAQRVMWGVRLGASGGLLLAAIELLVHAFGLVLPYGAAGWVALWVWLSVAGALFGAGAAWAAGTLVHWQPGGDPPVRVGAVIGIVAWLSAMLLLGERIVRLAIEGQVVGTIVLGLVPFVIATGVGVAARIVCRRWWRGRALRIEIGALAVLLVAGIAGGLINGTEPQPPSTAAEGPSVLLVSVDGWGASRSLPAFDALTPGGISFLQAVSPTSGSRGANTALLTGLHPLRSRVVAEGSHLSRGHSTLFEVLAQKGYTTGAFVSSASVESGTGLEQGFSRYDDDLSILRRSAPVRAFAGAISWVLDPSFSGALYVREPEETASAFVRWAEQQRTPFAAWVHLSHLGDDAAISLAADRIREALAGKDAVVVVAGARGALTTDLPGDVLRDEVVHVPLRVARPGEPPAVSEVDKQVRLMDVANTVLDALSLGEMPNSEGISLLGYGTGFRMAPLSCTLLGRSSRGEWLVGVRNNGVKAIIWPDGRDVLYLLDEDPEERVDRKGDDAAARAQARRLVASDRKALSALVWAKFSDGEAR